MLQNTLNELKTVKEVYSKGHRHLLKTGVKQIISETDGCMMPIVEINSKAKDKRKKKKLVYNEARLCLSYKDGDISQVNYLIDLFHMSEYLAAANAVITTDVQEQKCLLNRQIKLLKNNEIEKVLHYFEGYKDSPEEDNAAKNCYRYMLNRPEQFNYKNAIEHDLPIGSGKVEGGHRHVIQARLKISGAWWLKDSANPMLALRTNRINNQWHKYWDNR